MERKFLNQEVFEKASNFVLSSSRALERKIYEYYFNGDDPVEPSLELKNYQNSDGGFGHGLEPDIRLPYSTPIATKTALQRFDLIDSSNQVAEEIITGAMGYLENVFQEGENRWYSVSREVNSYPHAPWWHYDDETGKTPIDEFWGNPTAEILAYGLKYGFSDGFDTEGMVEMALNNFDEREKFESEHEVYCYLKLYEVLPAKQAEKLEDQLTKAVGRLVKTDPASWDDYVPKPLDFVKGPEAPRFGISDSDLEENLNFLVERLVQNEVIEPAWEWGQFDSEWERAKIEWTGVLTLEALATLKKFDRIDIN